MLLPHLFRKARNHAEAIGPFKERVPLDAHEHHSYIKRKEMKMAKAIRFDYRLNVNKPLGQPKGHIWSVATGEWVPEHLLKLHYIFPFSLGPMVAEQVSTKIQFRHSNNGMLIPPAVGQALSDVSDASEAKASKSLSRKGCRFASSSRTSFTSKIVTNSPRGFVLVVEKKMR